MLDNRTIGLIPGPRPCIRVKALLAGVLLSGLLVLACGTGIVSAVSFDLSYTDPASDVGEFWTSNMTAVLTDGNLTMSPFPDSVNVLHLTSANASADVTLTIQVKARSRTWTTLRTKFAFTRGRIMRHTSP